MDDTDLNCMPNSRPLQGYHQKTSGQTATCVGSVELSTMVGVSIGISSAFFVTVRDMVDLGMDLPLKTSKTGQRGGTLV